MKKIAVLGSTGSLGEQTFEVARKYAAQCQIVGLSAYGSLNKLRAQAKDLGGVETVLAAAGESVEKLAQSEGVDIVVNVLPGLAGLSVTRSAIEAGKQVLLGNKESLVAEGEKYREAIDRGQIITVDSEHDAIAEILRREDGDAEKIFIPCSGGPFLKRENLSGITVEEALNHPRWEMGPKVTLESATLINKGFEILEAHYLFNMPLEKVEAFAHPQCEIHGIVDFGTHAKAYYAAPDMREHIENALCRALEIEGPDRDIREVEISPELIRPLPHKKLPGIKLVLAAFKKAQTESKDQSKAMYDFLEKEELALQKFFAGQISFSEIFKLLE